MGLFSDFFGGSSQQKTRTIPKYAIPLFKEGLFPIGQDLLKGYSPEGTPTSQAGEAALLGTVRGDYLRPETNPYLASTADMIGRNAKEYLDKAIHGVNQGSQAGGTLLSTKNAQIRAEAGRKSGQDVTDALTRLYGGNYAQERGLQVGSIPTALGTADKNLLNALRVAQVWQGLVSTTTSSETPSILSAIQQGGATVGGAMAGYGGGGGLAGLLAALA